MLSLYIYLQSQSKRSSVKKAIKIGPDVKSFDELKKEFNLTKDEVSSQIENYIEFSTVEKGKRLVEKIFHHISICLGIISSLEKFGVNPNEVLENIKADGVNQGK